MKLELAGDHVRVLVARGDEVFVPGPNPTYTDGVYSEEFVPVGAFRAAVEAVFPEPEPEPLPEREPDTDRPGIVDRLLGR